MRVLNVMSINYKGCGTNNNNVNFENKKNFMPYMSKINFGNAASELPGNFGIVIADTLFRGRRPTTLAHFQALKEKGVTFLASLRGESFDDAEMAMKFGMEYIPINGQKFITNFADQTELNATIEIVHGKVESGRKGYVFCDEGAGRTGFFIAHYQAKIKILNQTIPEIRKHYLMHNGDAKWFDEFIQKTITDF